MKKSVFVAAALLAATAFVSAEPLEYPGNVWGVATFPSATVGAERNNVLAQGRIEQGIVWFRFADGKWKLNTYAALGYSLDSEGISYNNKAVPAVGVKVTREFEQGVVDLGVQAVQENRWKDNVHSSGVQAYASWWFGWNLKK